MLAPIWLDEADQATIENLRHWLWARTKQDAFLQSLRWAVGAVRKTPGCHEIFCRESGAPVKTLTLRLSEDQRQHLEEFGKKTASANNAESVRLIIRMAEYFFRNA